MGESRGKRSKKAKWQVQLGIKELIFAVLGVAGFAMMSFALGTLAGRGDIYRVLYNWGLLSPDRTAVQMWGQAPSLSAAPVAPVANLPGSETPDPQTATASPSPKSPPVTGDIAALPKKPSHPEKNKSSKQAAQDKTDNLDKIRREVAGKLKFQNSLDLAPARRKPPAGEAKRGADQEGTTGSKVSTSLIIVAKFRDANRAKIKLSQMRQQGDKVVLKEGKDAEGHYFAIYRQITATPSPSPQVAQSQLKKTKPENKPGKSAGQ